MNSRKRIKRPLHKKGSLELNEINDLKDKLKKISEIDSTSLTSFDLFPLCNKTLSGLTENKFKEPTKVQQLSLVHSLRGFDVVAAAKTGSGKTLAFIIPLLELLYEKRWGNMDGIGALIVTPTRELAYQIFEVLNKVGKNHDFSAGLVIGGKDLKFEWGRASKCNIIICTPGRLLQHMNENPDFNCDNLQILVLDEADQCLSMGFTESMNAILAELPKQRQTLLFSATQTKDMNNLIRAGCNNPIFCSAHEHSKTITPDTLKESFMVCEEDHKINFLWSFLTHHKRNKILVFLATCKQVQYLNELFTHLRPGISVMALHGNMHQLRRMAVYDSFCNKSRAVLFATDVAARGWDIPKVDWVLQLDCPEDVTTYIHRAGRTARHTSGGESLLVLSPSQETGMIAALNKKHIQVEKIDVDPRKLMNIRTKMGMFLNKFNGLREVTERAFKAYIKSYSMMKNKNIFNVENINLEEYARSLGLVAPPRVRFLERQLKMKNKSISNKDVLGSSSPSSKIKREEEDFVIVLKDQNSSLEDEEKEQIATKLFYDERGNYDFGSGDKYFKTTEDDNACSEWTNIQCCSDLLREMKITDKRRQKEIRRNSTFKEKKKKVNASEDDGDDDEENEIQLETDDDDEIDSNVQDLIDMLPDPDKIYERTHQTDSDSDQERNSVQGSDSDQELTSVQDSEDKSIEQLKTDKMKKPKKRVFMGEKLAKERFKKAKRAKLEQENQLSSIPFDEKQNLALFLLKGDR